MNTITDDLHTTNRVDNIIRSCSQSVYALRVLKAHGLPSAGLHSVAWATTIARLLYASSAWWGLTIESDRARIDRFYKRLKRFDYIPDNVPSITELVGQGDDRLFGQLSLTHYMSSGRYSHRTTNGHMNSDLTSPS